MFTEECQMLCSLCKHCTVILDMPLDISERGTAVHFFLRYYTESLLYPVPTLLFWVPSSLSLFRAPYWPYYSESLHHSPCSESRTNLIILSPLFTLLVWSTLPTYPPPFLRIHWCNFSRNATILNVGNSSPLKVGNTVETNLKAA
jgi:hypothetical protein